jgi:hypothetical protein
MSKHDERVCARTAKAIALECVRNTFLEDLHAGRSPLSVTGDYSDVKVVDARGEIPWREVSRISDEEMKRFMIEVVNNIYTVLLLENVPLRIPNNWDPPQLVEAFVQRVRKKETAIPSEEGGAPH